MAELADAIDLGSIVNRRAGSSPVIRSYVIKTKRAASPFLYRVTPICLFGLSGYTLGNPQ